MKVKIGTSKISISWSLSRYDYRTSIIYFNDLLCQMPLLLVDSAKDKAKDKILNKDGALTDTFVFTFD